MATKKKVDEAAEAKINAAYAKKAGVKPMSEMPEYKNFGKSKPAAKKSTASKPAAKKGCK